MTISLHDFQASLGNKPHPLLSPLDIPSRAGCRINYCKEHAIALLIVRDANSRCKLEMQTRDAGGIRLDDARGDRRRYSRYRLDRMDRRSSHVFDEL